MGLDMYLEERVFIGAHYDHRGVKGTIDITEETSDAEGNKIDKPIQIPFRKVSYILLQVGYWRKANAIHQWFVDNCGGGQDNCQPYYVDREDLEKLRDVCVQVLGDKSKAKELLPPQEGFFFGSYEIDEWYMQDIAETIKIIDGVLHSPRKYSEYYYQASW